MPTLDLKCPHCGFEGGFPRKEIHIKFRPWHFLAGTMSAILGVIFVRNDPARTDRTFICPQCGVEVYFPEGIRIYDKMKSGSSAMKPQQNQERKNIQ